MTDPLTPCETREAARLNANYDIIAAACWNAPYMTHLIRRDYALKACMLREDNPPTEMQLSLRNVISALPAIDPAAIREAALQARIEELVKEREARHSNPADFRYWEGRYRDEKARAEAAEAKLATAVEALHWAYDTLKEINLSSYNHDDVSELNDASVEVILGIAAMLAGLEGKTKC